MIDKVMTGFVCAWKSVTDDSLQAVCHYCKIATNSCYRSDQFHAILVNDKLGNYFQRMQTVMFYKHLLHKR